MIIDTRFDPLLVILSILVAVFSSYVALNLANSVSHSKGRAQAVWIGAGALAMGIGIWSMHFVGMLAFEMPGMTMAYDVPLMILSVLVAIGGSGLALFVAGRSFVAFSSVVSGGIAMAAAIAGMHYIGMSSMRMAATAQWNFPLVALSIIIAIVASFSALFILIHLRNRTSQTWKLLLAGTVMGIAISGMHYTGMYAATFFHSAEANIQNSNLLVSSGLTAVVIAATIFILSVALASSIGRRIWAERRQKTKEILGKSEEKFRRLVEAVKDYAILILDPDGFITSWNLGAERITGYANEEIVGKHISILYTKKELENGAAEIELEAAKTAGHFESEGQRKRKDGSLYWASIVVAPLINEEGKLIGFSKIQRDITQFIESEKNMRQLNEELENRVKIRTRLLEQRENQLRTITNALPVLIAEFDQNE